MSELLQKVQETAHVTFEEWYERTSNVEPYVNEYGVSIFRGKGQLEEEKCYARGKIQTSLTSSSSYH